MYNSKDYFKYICSENNIKLKDYLRNQGISARYYREVTRESVILVNKEVTRTNRVLSNNDEILIKIPEENLNALPEKGHINILYEDDDLLIVNKEPFMPTHTVRSTTSGTLLNYLCNYFLENNIKRKVRIVNRLDKNTSGIVLIAKNSHAHSEISKQFQEDRVIKKYIAITKNNFKEKKLGIIELPIKRSEEGIKRVVSTDGKYSKTGYKVLDENNDYSIVLLRLYTGRTHQLRVHLSSINCPIIGDELYFEESNLIKRQALHSYYMEFNHPRTKERLVIKAPLFDDMKGLILK